MSSQTEPTSLYLVGRNRISNKREEHLFVVAGSEISHVWSLDRADSENESLEAVQFQHMYARLLLAGLRPQQLLEDRTGLSKLMYNIELVLRNHVSIVYFTGFTAITAAYIAITGISGWYEWVVFVAGLLLGTVINRAVKITFWGASVEMEQWTAAALYQAQIQELLNRVEKKDGGQ